MPRGLGMHDMTLTLKYCLSSQARCFCADIDADDGRCCTMPPHDDKDIIIFSILFAASATPRIR